MEGNLDTDLLRAFVTVWQTNSFTKASEKLYRTQAAVSLQIKRLEECIRRPIFLRERKGLRLTEDGELLLGYAQRILQLNDDAIVSLNAQCSNTVRIGTSDDLAAVLLPTALSHLSEALPNVRTEVICGNSPVLLRELEAANLDLALVSVAPEDGGGTGELIRDERLFWVAAENGQWRSGAPLPLALFSTGCVCRKAALDALRNVGHPWKIVLESNSISTVLAAVSAGFAITVMEDCMVPRHSRRLTADDGVPRLDNAHIKLHKRTDGLSKAANLLANYLTTYLRRPEHPQIVTQPLSPHRDLPEQIGTIGT
jgi:DNA-binding transcriptional LysR family regulator